MPNWRTGAGLAMALAIAALPGCSDRLASPQPGPPKTPTAASLSGHRRMLDLLVAIRERTPEENPWLGDSGEREAREALSAIPDGEVSPRRLEALSRLAQHELRLGRETDAIAHWQEAYALLDQLAGKVPGARRNFVVFRLGLAHLRRGETQNCAANPTAEACILPLSRNAIHRLEEGSRQAIRYFTEVLEATAGDDPMHHKSLWLLNLAYMTLDQHPEKVPSRYRIPPQVFESDAPFPRFQNIAPAVGVATFNLFGSAVVDDFDGDFDLDLITSTFDTSSSIRFFRNEGTDPDGRVEFSDQSVAAGLAGLYGGLNAIQGDYDNDGDLDLYVLRGAWLSEQGRHPNSLLRNEGVDGQGQVRFVDVTFESGLGEVHYPTQTAVWADVDNDGDLDLYVGNEHGQRIDAPNQLFRNNLLALPGSTDQTASQAAGQAESSDLHRHRTESRGRQPQLRQGSRRRRLRR